jgi:GWxTD domain-containing protein
MTTRTPFYGWIALALALAVPAPPAAAGNEAPLSSEHKAWLANEAAVLITPAEREAFGKLSSDRERALFIEAFWQQRDPTPGTARNEFREEHARRLAFVDRIFGEGAPGRGGITERGRIYLILGPPLDVRKFISAKAYPMEIWSYANQAGLGQAPSFRLLFFKPERSGEYRLYDPSSHSPKDLLLDPLLTTGTSVAAQGDIAAALKKKGWDEIAVQSFLRLESEVSPEVAESTLSVIPGLRDPGQIAPSSILLAEIQKAPWKKVDEAYVRAFLEHKTAIETGYSLQAMTNRSTVRIFKDPSGFFRIHYLLAPERISMGAFGDKFVGDWRRTLRLNAPDGTLLYREEKIIPVELYRAELKAVQKSEFQFYDSLPVVPGECTLNILLENMVSKEFTSLQAAVSVPAGPKPGLSPVLLARKAIRVAAVAGGATRSFQIGDIQIDPAVDAVIGARTQTAIFFQVYNASPETRAAGIVEFAILQDGRSVRSFRRSFSAYKDGMSVCEDLPTDTLAPGSYSVQAFLRDPQGKELASGRAELKIADTAIRPAWILPQPQPSLEDAYYNGVLGTQYLNKNDIDMAAQELSLARYKKPEVLEYALGYAQALLVRKEYDMARAAVRKFADQDVSSFDLYSILGRSAQGLGETKAAIAGYQKALILKGDDVVILNSLGDCYLKEGDGDMARQAWRKSLAVKPDQADVQKKIESIK